MSTSIPKEWAALDDDEILLTEPTEHAVREELRRRGRDVTDYEVVVVPKPYVSMYV